MMTERQRNLTLNAGFGGDFLLTFVQHFRNLEIGEIDHILGCLFQILFISPGSLEKWSNFTNIFRMGWNHHLVLFIMIHPPFEASWGHVFVITLLLSSTDIITCILNTFSGEKGFLPSTLTIQNPKKNTNISKKNTPTLEVRPLPVACCFRWPFPPIFSVERWRHERSMEPYDSTLKTCQTRQRREGGFKEGHDIYPVDVITKHFQVPI